jgi:hypothetical protein
MEKLYLSGSGEMLTKISGGSLIKFGTIQNLSISTNATFKELFAGAGLFPVVSRAFEKSIECSAEIASFEKDFIEISQGLDSSDPSTVDRFVSSEPQTVAAGVVTVDKDAYNATYTYVVDSNGNKLTRVSGSPSSGEYQESDPTTGEITVNTELNDTDIYISYVYSYNYTLNADDVEAMMVKADVLPNEFQLWYQCLIEEGSTTKGVEIMFYKCIPTTDMKLNFARDFVIPNFTFKVTDPKRGDERIGYYLIR